MRILFSTLFLVLILAIPALPQLSPGDLQMVHKDLEGLKNCQKCHEAGKQVSADKCLDCHKILESRIKDGLGLHAGPDYKDCIHCHVEHLGRDAELIWWDGGMEKFDHAKTGHRLLGKHIGIECRRCHTGKNIVDKKVRESKTKNPNRTFLGLNMDCSSCHIDEHRGQVGKDCNKCHNTDGWKPPALFNHKNTKFPLTGKHTDVKCEKCHKTIVDNLREKDPDYLLLSPIKHDNCLDCHQDSHKGKFGDVCTKCHVTSGWRTFQKADFDHDKTNYPLRGMHVKVQCQSCHPAGKKMAGLKHDFCADCHKDYHEGQMVNRKPTSKCEDCHTIDGFSPAKYGIEDHNKSKYPLVGAHLAVPCIACHAKIDLENGSKTTRFLFKSTACQECHGDPHKGAASKYVQTDGCEFCHTVESWRKSIYDHKKSGFELVGKHLEAACGTCHKPLKGELRVDNLRFSGLNRRCMDCHKDIHKDQFVEMPIIDNNKVINCDRCHTPEQWKPSKFDHNKQSAFKLEGSHLKTPCTGCHKTVGSGEKAYILYKPLDSACASCHKTEVKMN